jgi:hypothetical protein
VSFAKFITAGLLVAGGTLGLSAQFDIPELDTTPAYTRTADGTPADVTPTPHVVPRPTTEPGVMDQADFPCQEDEALIYHPRFGPDRVGCVSIDEVRSTTW